MITSGTIFEPQGREDLSTNESFSIRQNEQHVGLVILSNATLGTCDPREAHLMENLHPIATLAPDSSDQTAVQRIAPY
jgi:hypothetical protein